MKAPGARLMQRVQRAGDEVGVPMTRGLGLTGLLRRTFEEMSEDHVGAFAGNLAYKGLFALFPFSVFLLSLLGLFGAPDLVYTILDRVGPLIPAGANELLREQLLALTRSQAGGAFTIGALISIAAALWGVSGAFRSVMEAMNVMYEVEEARPFWKKYLISIFLALAVAILLLTALSLVIFGEELSGLVAGVVGFGEVFRLAWAVAQWPVLVFFVAFAFALVYYLAPDVEQRFKWVSPGSLVAVALWLLFSLVFSLYVNNFGSYNATYGSLAGVAILMLYLYYTAFIVLMGAEINQVIEEHVPEGKNEGEKTPGDVQG